MKLKDSRGVSLALRLVGALSVVVVLTAHAPHGGSPGERISVPHDWSHRHLVFSAPSSIWQAWKLQQEPRYWHQRLRRNTAVLQADNSPESAVDLANLDSDGLDLDPDGRERDRRHRRYPLRRDWGASLGANATVGDGMFPAKFSFDANATPSCAGDYVVFTTSLAGSGTSPSIVAFNQLYSGTAGGNGLCGTGGPTVTWSYNTGAGTVVTSSVLSLDGKKVAFVETSGSGAVLHILKWKATQGTVAAPATPNTTLGANAAWSTCPAANSCIANITFNGSQPDTNSSPFYNYNTDVLYVGDDNGSLHKFTGVFNGTPQEVTTSHWPITVDSGTILSSPVFDSQSGNIFIGDSSGRLSYVREVGSSKGMCGSGSTACLGSTTQSLGGSIVDGPIVDSTTGRVFWFDGTSTSPSSNGEVVQTDTQLSSLTTLSGIGGNSSGSAMHAGDFDNAYFSGSLTAGHLYICGKDPSHGDRRPCGASRSTVAAS